MPRPNRSPLFFYAREYQRRHGQRMNINEAITACYDDWKALSEEEKQPYKIQYEEWRIQYRVNPESVNVSNQYVKNKKQINNDNILHERDIPCEELKHHYDRFTIERNFLTSEYLPLDISELLLMPIYIINFQIFCKVDEEDGGQFIPAEMCILRFTLTEGVTTYRQKFIKSDKIPSGYMSSCLEHLKETHQIPLKNFSEATDNYEEIFYELKSFLLSTTINKINHISNNDDRTRRRYLRLTQPCVFFPSLEYEQTYTLLDWLQEKAEGIKPTKDTRLVNLASIESLIMILADLKKYHVSRDDIQKTFANAAYSFMIEERCPYHLQLGISHCSIARCHAAAKLISAYLNQLYVPERSTTGRHSQNSIVNKTNQSSIDSMNTMSNRVEQSLAARPTRTITEKLISNQYSSTDTTDSIATSYCSLDQRKQNEFYQSNDDEITKLQQQNFHRLLSNAESTYPSNNNNYLSEYTIDNNSQISNHSNMQRNILNQRKQILLKAIQSIDKQIEELDIHCDQ
ncbi:unnamed protein product [Rotaria sordida]|uniref:HMG box domain-containing protein n=2 Tax=Rotaria sordida TaxID=392033 RepID=A0A815DAG1_9BILA|nr:unnamed protein product [Rotaria sordida]CAF3850739.1 unnamed protein product [Rotaria sordida]